MKRAAPLLIVACFVTGAVNARAAAGLQDQSARFDKWGIAFEYPKSWREYAADRTANMKEAFASQAKPFGLDLKEFAMIVGPNEELAVLITKIVRSKAFEPSEIVAERNQVYEDAKRAGDVTKINFVKITKIAGWPTVEEDVERSNGGRGRTHKMILGKTIFEISFIVSSARNFSKYEPAMGTVLATMTVVNKID